MTMWFEYPGVADRFDAKTTREGECLVWTGGRAGGKAVKYGTFRLSRPFREHKYAHRLALERKIGRPLIGKERAIHSCDNPPCVNPDHLRVGTQADNMRDCSERGRTVRGERSFTARLTEQDVREIVALLPVKGLTRRQIGARYGVSGAAITAISTGRNWRHVTAVVRPQDPA